MAEDGITEILERNQRGELWVRAQNIMKGYWRNPKATQEIKTGDGWLRTGDIAYVDDQGKFHVVDRMKVCHTHRGKVNQKGKQSDSAAGVDQSQGESSGPCRTGSTSPGTSRDSRCCGDRSRDVSYMLFLSLLPMVIAIAFLSGPEINQEQQRRRATSRVRCPETRPISYSGGDRRIHGRQSLRNEADYRRGCIPGCDP